MRRNVVLCAAVVAVSVLLFASCQRGKNQAKSAVVIRWWHINSDMPSRAVFEDLAREFGQSRARAKVEVTMLENIEYKAKLELEFAAKDPPDVFHSWGGGNLAEQAKAGYLRDITEWGRSDRWQSKINPAALALFSWEGKIYGFPHDLGAVGFWYNSEILRAAGYESFPREWPAFVSMLDRLKARGVTPVALGIADRWPVMYYWVYLAMRLGGADLFPEILAGRRGFNDPAMAKAGHMMRDLYLRGYFSPTGIGDDFMSQSRQMGDGECAMQLMGQWALAVQAQSSERKDALASVMRFAPFPSVPGGKGGINDAMGGGNGFVIGSKAPDEAIELLEYFTRAENLQRYFDAFPAVPTVEAVRISSPGLRMVKDYLSGMENYCLYPDQLFPLAIGTAINEMSARVILGEITPEAACVSLQATWEQARDAR